MNTSHYSLLLKRLGLLLLTYNAGRMIFFLLNFAQIRLTPGVDQLLAFGYGLRFDLAAIAVLNIVFVVLSLLPFAFQGRKGYQQFLKVFFLVTNIPFLILNVADAEYFKFIGRRSTINMVGIRNDVSDQILQLLGYYWYLGIVAIVVAGVLIRFYPMPGKSSGTERPARRVHPALGTIVVAAGIALCILAFRGGLQLKPLRPYDAFRLNSTVLGNLSLNSTFTFLTSVDMRGTQEVHYFDNRSNWRFALQRDFRELYPTHQQPQNVVIIILESFALEYMGHGNPYKGYTPFLDSLATQSLFFKNHFSNGRESIDAVPAITAGIPHLMDESYITSVFQANEVYGLPKALRSAGYSTSFFHGGKNGTMGFEGFAYLAGYEKYYGLNQYPEAASDFDGNWGIFDEPYLQYFAGMLSRQRTPFLSTVFTLSSHQPYTIPAQYKGKFPKGPAPVHETIGYTDYALRRFFETARRQPWYQNTLFILTADHTQANTEALYANPLGSYRVPLIMFHPGERLEADTTKITQHTDIMPSVLDYLHVPSPKMLPFGQSVFSHTPGLALQFNFGMYRLVKADYFLEMNTGGESRLFNFRQDPGQANPLDKPEVKAQMEGQLKAFIQFYNNGLIHNNWYEEYRPQRMLVTNRQKTAGGS